ncbi:MAG: GNAT family N-acetyltransferase [Actinomycetota bacterium]|nr:GNAT family N-acetyltransferase [Actinomycetota bacterium]
MPDGARTRRYDPGDAPAVASILYESSGGLYDRYAGSRALAERAISRALAEEGTSASADVVYVAELGGQVAGAMAAMPYPDWTPRAHAFLRATLRSIPPWRWPRAIAVYRASGRAAPEPPRSCFYVDSLATSVRFRRRGVARALLEEADLRAGALGLRYVALDTWIDNHAARCLYAEAGFEEVAQTPGRGLLPGGVSLVKDLAGAGG